MAYLGKYETRTADFKVYTSSTATATHTLSWTPTSKQSLRITINGVVQQDDAFELVGTTVTLDAAILVTDVLEIVGVNELGGQVLVPADGSIQAGKLSSNAVTTAKIQDDAVTLAKMAGGTDGNLITYDASGDPAYVATGSATNILTSNGAGAAPTFQAAAAGGFTHAQQWRVTADFAVGALANVRENWEKPEASRFPGSIGSDMAVDSSTSATLSGAWTFPEEGTWLVRWNFYNEGVGGSQSLNSRIWVTDDNGASWVEVAKNDSYGFHNQDVTVTNEYMFNVDDTTTDKMRFQVTAAGFAMVIRGDTNANAHYATFMRLGDKA